MSQEGNAGRDLIQIGRDYINYVQVNASSNNWGAVFFALLPAFFILWGLKAAGDKVLTVFSSSSSSAETKAEAGSPQPISTLPNVASDIPNVASEPSPSVLPEFVSQQETISIICPQGDNDQGGINENPNDRINRAFADDVMKYQKLDTIVNVRCFHGSLSEVKITNYSTKAIEFFLGSNGVHPGLLLPDEDYEYEIRRTGIDETTLSLKTYPTTGITKQVTISCDDSPFSIWNISFQAQCVPPGIRLAYTNISGHAMSVSIPGSSDPPIYLRAEDPGNLVSPGSGTAQSSNESMTLILQPAN